MPAKIETKGNIAIIKVDNPPVNLIIYAAQSEILVRVSAAAKNNEFEGFDFTGDELIGFGNLLEYPILYDLVATYKCHEKRALATINIQAVGDWGQGTFAVEVKIAGSKIVIISELEKAPFLDGASSEQYHKAVTRSGF